MPAARYRTRRLPPLPKQPYQYDVIGVTYREPTPPPFETPVANEANMSNGLLHRRHRNKLITATILVFCLYILVTKVIHIHPSNLPDLEASHDASQTRSTEEEEERFKVTNKSSMAVTDSEDTNIHKPHDKSKLRPVEMEPNDPQYLNKALKKEYAPIYNERRASYYHSVWEWADKAISQEELWPESHKVDEVLSALKTARIVHVDKLDIGYHESGTSEKWLLMLEGGQRAMMKIVWETKGTMKRGALCNYGFEMPWSEISGFNLHRVLGMRNTPYVTGRRINLRREILPAATPTVAQQIILRPGSQTCVRGKCFHCKLSYTMCPSDGYVEASIAYWIPRRMKMYTYPPNYMPYSTTNAEEWEKYGFNEKTYCRNLRNKFYPYTRDRFYFDLFDFSVMDTLMYHYDSKHYMVHDDSDAHGLTIRLDHGRSFCANDRDDEHVFLAPINQCCTLRMRTWKALRSLKEGDLTRKLKFYLDKDPLAPVLEDRWFSAMERRLKKIKRAVEHCAEANGGFQNILIGSR